MPVSRVRKSREVLVRVSRRLKIVHRKSVFGDGQSLRLGQVPIKVLCCTASEGYCDDDREDARHRPNEKEISHGRVSWQTR